MLFLAALFLWSNAASFLDRNPPKFLEVILSEELFLTVAQAVRFQINDAYATFRFVASGKDLKTFLMAIGGLWIFSIISNWFSFLTLFYIVFTIICSLPALEVRG
ncbi:Reticulon-like protein B6 [Dendrobium catenatum]|uniref:Reticulon-like protein n=1 Tax=Dendrobium catenatum TaxID=906689 RepID=A0A2I0VJI1_9ASPA|nr:Reticulon-like protein B6 [Dendrobium catenatum]